jgi:hypothetical protein
MDARLSQDEARNVYDGVSRFYDLIGAIIEGRARELAIRLATDFPKPL